MAHAGAVRVEEADDVRLHTGLTPGREEERLAEPFRFVIAGAWTDGVDVAPVRLGLGMDERVAVDLRGRCEQEPRSDRARHFEESVHAERVGAQRMHGHAVVVHGAGRGRQVRDDVDLDLGRLRDVGLDELVAIVSQEVGDVADGTRGEIVHADDLVALSEQ